MLNKKQRNPKAEYTVYRYTPDPEYGLDAEKVSERQAQNLTNKTSSDNRHSTAKIITKNVFTYFNIIFFVFAAVLLWQRSYNHMAFLGVVVSNTVIGIVQELRSRKMLDKLNLMACPTSNVIRGGVKMTVNSEDLVLDDITELESGDQIPADAVVVSGEIFVNESLVTGEADEIKKVTGDRLLSGSFAVSGKCRARLDAVGDESFASRLMSDAKKTKKRTRPGMMRSLNILIMAIGIIIIPFALIMYFNQHATLGLSVKESVENAVASSIGMIPEGLYLLTSVALAASTIRLAKGGTLVHDMKCIESLARVDVICVDKTGTITEPEMALDEIVPVCQDQSGALQKLCSLVSAMETQNVTSDAVTNYFVQNDIKPFGKAVRKKEFSSLTKYSACSLDDGNTYVFGAPEMLLGSDFSQYDGKISEYISCGKRVLAFGKVFGGEDSDSVLSENGCNVKIEPLLFAVLSNPIRQSAAQTFSYFASQGVNVKVISGDNPAAVAAVAAKAGIPNADKYVDASKLSDEELTFAKTLECTVFGRVSPEQKRLIIRALKKNKHTVAMTGDGVNDVLALKDADCSVAMASGSKSAANVSDMVLVNSDFSSMPHVVDEGRRVINNIERTASMFLVKNIFSFFMTLLSIITVSYYPLKPVQISLASCMMIGIPSFFLALEPNKELVKGKFLRNVLYRAFPTALTAVFLVECLIVFAQSFGIEYAMMSTVACIVYSAAGYMMLYKVCKPFNTWHITLFSAMGILYILCIALLPEFFNISRLDIGCVLLTVLLILPMMTVQNYISAAFEFVRLKYLKLKAKLLQNNTQS